MNGWMDGMEENGDEMWRMDDGRERWVGGIKKRACMHAHIGRYTKERLQARRGVSE